MSPDELSSLLAKHRDDLKRFVARQGSGLLRHETEDDLVQGVQLKALGVAALVEHRGEHEFFAWLSSVARQYIADRHAYWSALRRKAGRMLRITARHTTSAPATAGVDPIARVTGPSTLAARREDLALATRALALLLPRDQELVRWMTEGIAIADVAERLGVGYDAAERARLRALERFRKTFELLSRGRGTRD